MRKLSIVAIAAVAASSAYSQVSYGTNFDPATYTTGNLVPQDGWTAGSNGTATNQISVSSVNSLSSPQSAFLQGNVTGGGSFTSVGHAFAAGPPSVNTNLLTASANIWVDSLGAGVDRYFGIGFGTAAAATSGFMGIALGGTGLRGNGGSYASYNSNATGLLQGRTVNDFLQRWVGLSIVADRSITTNNVVFTFTNLGTSGGNATETFTKSVNFGTTNLSIVQMFSDWDGTSTNPGQAFIDNVSFSASPVPEPASMAVLGLGALAMLRRRNKKA